VLAVFSTSLLDSGFLLPRTVPGTAVLFTEPDVAISRTSISRQTSYGHSHTDPSCNRPIIRFGAKISAVKRHPTIENAMKVLKKITNHPVLQKVQDTIGRKKMGLYDKLNLGCLVPKILRPFDPVLLHISCKLGLNEDKFMEAAPCNEVLCEESLEEKEITRDNGGATMPMMNLGVQTMSDCFGEMPKVMYGARVLAKIVDDQSCDDPKYQQVCQEVMDQNRVIDEDGCLSEK
jgi:hypothetical protein